MPELLFFIGAMLVLIFIIKAITKSKNENIRTSFPETRNDKY